jgi:SAM-dependent methyltransferase
MADSRDRDAAVFDTDFPSDLENQLMLNWYPQRIMRTTRGWTALELGLGHGYATKVFSRHFRRLMVIEDSAAVIQRFREQETDVQVEIVERPFEDFDTDERFEHIIMGFVLDHVDDPGLILSKYRNFLSPSGSVYVAVPNAESLNRRIGHAAGLLPDMQALSKSNLALGQKRYFTLESLRGCLRRQGYRVCREEGIYLKPFSTKQLQGLRLPESILESMLKVGIDYPELCAGILVEAVPSKQGY